MPLGCRLCDAEMSGQASPGVRAWLNLHDAVGKLIAEKDFGIIQGVN